jgi:hypothetical protein
MVNSMRGFLPASVSADAETREWASRLPSGRLQANHGADMPTAAASDPPPSTVPPARCHAAAHAAGRRVLAPCKAWMPSEKERSWCLERKAVKTAGVLWALARSDLSSRGVNALTMHMLTRKSQRHLQCTDDSFQAVAQAFIAPLSQRIF